MEEALYEAFLQAFPGSIHLLCSINMRRNIKQKLCDLKVNESTKLVVLGDIFGQDKESCHYDGLVDAENEKEYGRGIVDLANLTRNGGKWILMIVVQCIAVEWFLMYKSKLVKKALLKCKRKEAGLGDPPVPFTTNASESINALLRIKCSTRKVIYRRSASSCC